MRAPKQPTRIHAATPADAGLLAGLGAQCFRDAWARYNDAADMDAYCAAHFTDALLREDLARPDVHYLLAGVDGEHVGYLRAAAGAAPACVMAAAPVEISRLYVLGRCQGMGIGSDLMRAGLDAAASAGHGIAWLAVWQRAVQALHFYRKWDFEIVGTTTFRLGADLQQDYVMQRPVAMGAAR